MPGCCVVQAEHIAVDDVAGEHKASQALFFVNGHLRNGGLEGSVRLAGEADLHTGTQRLTVLPQQLLALFGRTHAHIAPGEAGNDLAGTAVQRQEWG